MDGCGRGSSTSTTVPASSRWLFGWTLPSTVTTRSRSSFSAREREPISPRSARTLSKRAPASESATVKRTVAIPDTVRAARAIGEDESAEEYGDTDDDERVREVERGPRLEVEEVGDPSEPHAVEQVRDAASEDEAERDRQDRMAAAGAREEPEHPPDRHRCHGDDHGCPTRKEAERHPGVLHVADRERPDDIDALPDVQGACDHLLRQLIG